MARTTSKSIDLDSIPGALFEMGVIGPMFVDYIGFSRLISLPY